MSNSSWSERLAQSLTILVKKNKTSGGTDPQRIAILGIGNEINGDDAAGVEIVRRLQASLTGIINLLLVDGGTAPENFTGPIRRFAPQMVILVDCADMGATPGTIAWLEMDEVEGFSASTHTLPPTVLAQFLSNELDCEIGLIGIQPEMLELGAPFSAGVQTAVDQIVNTIVRLFNPYYDVG